MGPAQGRHRRADRAGGVQAGPLGVRGRLPVAPAQPNRPSELTDQKLALVAGLFSSKWIVELVGLVDLLLELVETGLVGGAGLGVQKLAGVAEVRADLELAAIVSPGRGGRLAGPADQRFEVGDVKLAAGLGQQEGDLPEPLRVLQSDDRAV